MTFITFVDSIHTSKVEHLMNIEEFKIFTP